MGRKRSENGRQGRKTEDWQTGDGKERRESIGGRTSRQRWGNGEAEMGKWAGGEGKWAGGEGEMGRQGGEDGQATFGLPLRGSASTRSVELPKSRGSTGTLRFPDF